MSDRNIGALCSRAIETIESGGVICMPTETFYGLCADATNPAACSRIFKIKRRETDKPVPLLLPSINDLEKFVGEVTNTAKLLMDRYWPGPLNLVFRAKQPSPLAVPMLTGTIALRLSSDPVASLIAAEVGKPIVATSANISGQPPAAEPRSLSDEILSAIDFLLDDGPRSGILGSTIVDVTESTPRILRHGDLDISWEI